MTLFHFSFRWAFVTWVTRSMSCFVDWCYTFHSAIPLSDGPGSYPSVDSVEWWSGIPYTSRFRWVMVRNRILVWIPLSDGPESLLLHDSVEWWSGIVSSFGFRWLMVRNRIPVWISLSNGSETPFCVLVPLRGPEPDVDGFRWVVRNCIIWFIWDRFRNVGFGRTVSL